MPDLKSLLKKKNDLNIFKLNETANFVKQMKNRFQIFEANPNENSHIKFFALCSEVIDIPIKCGSLEEMYDVMRTSILTKMTGHNFCLGMLTDDGKYEVYIRTSQPCQGGEMRKYGVSHDDCTRPDDPRPTDLSYPFPDGKPLAVGTRASLNNTTIQLLNTDSVYARAFGTRENVEVVGSSQGFIVKDADQTDPTVFVNLVHKIKDNNVFDPKMLEDFSFPEAMILHQYGIDHKTSIIHKHSTSSNNKYNTSFLNLKEYLKGGVHSTQDITGGTLGQRYDYNRPDLITIFKGGEKEVEPCRVLNSFFFPSGGGTKKIPYKEVVEMKKDIKEALRKAA
jgi:hypothetical protein